jgi:hypothetical protein
MPKSQPCNTKGHAVDIRCVHMLCLMFPLMPKPGRCAIVNRPPIHLHEGGKQTAASSLCLPRDLPEALANLIRNLKESCLASTAQLLMQMFMPCLSAFSRRFHTS